MLAGERTLIGTLGPKNGKEQREKFLTGGIDNPQFEYEAMDEESYQQKMSQLDKLEGKVKDESDEIVRGLYQAKIESTRQQLQMRVSIGRDPVKFSQASLWLFGAPSEAAYKLALAEKAVEAKPAQKTPKEQSLDANKIRLVFIER